MTPREEILEALGEDFDGGVPTDINRIREILSRHELVPIDNTEEAKETVTDSIIKKLEVYVENNVTAAPFLQSEKDDIRLEVLDEVGKLEEENAAHVSLLKTYSERIAGLEDKLRWRDCKTEPPEVSGLYIVRQSEGGQPGCDHFRVGMGWENAGNGGPFPHSWRPIE